MNQYKQEKRIEKGRRTSFLHSFEGFTKYIMKRQRKG